MSELNASNLRKEKGNEGPDLVGTTELTSPYFMVPPSGTTAERPQNPQKGTLRFNTDVGSLEFYRGDTIGWEQIVRTTPNLGGGTGSNVGVGARGLMMGLSTPSFTNQIDYITISTFGNAQDFGDLGTAKANGNAFGNSTRGAYCGGQTTPAGNTWTDDTLMVFFATLGNTTDYATLTGNRKEGGAMANETRGLYVGAGYNSIDYVTISQGGNWVDFGDMSTGAEQCATLTSSTRGVTTLSSLVPAYSTSNIIEYLTIATTGNTSDFGDLSQTRYGNASGSSATRGVFAVGYQAPAVQNTIEYITIATTGNAIDFGDTTEAKYANAGSCSSTTRMCLMGGHRHPSPVTDVIECVEIATTGNGVDFGNLTSAAASTACSNGHGGL